ncbi:MAG: hypothetical protein NVSMB14_03030 [Isosphaeraceae bacterium]
MALLADFIVADSSTAKSVGESTIPFRDQGGLETKGIDTVKLGTLDAILSRTQFNPQRFDDSLIYEVSKDGPWVFLVSPDFVARLALVQEFKLSPIALEWWKTEEFSSRFSRWTAEEVEQVLRDLAVLARLAVAESQSLLMRIGL